VPPAYAIQGFYGVKLLERRVEPTAALLEVMGLKELARDGDYIRFAPAGDALGRYVDVLVDPKAQPGRQGAGSVHHIGFGIRTTRISMPGTTPSSLWWVAPVSGSFKRKGVPIVDCSRSETMRSP
jgi:hypothetical protein